MQKFALLIINSFKLLSKSTLGKQSVEDIPNFTCICVYVFICVFICVTPPGQMKNDTDLKFSTHTPIALIKKRVFCFFRKMTVRAVSLDKLPCHVDCLHISSIALLFFYLVQKGIIDFSNDITKVFSKIQTIIREI